MLSRKELRFERRSILTAAQLRAIEKFPREILRLMFLENGDGIISGLDYVERGGEIFLTEGLVKIGGTFYFAAETNLSALMRNAAAAAAYSGRKRRDGKNCAGSQTPRRKFQRAGIWDVQGRAGVFTGGA